MMHGRLNKKARLEFFANVSKKLSKKGTNIEWEDSAPPTDEAYATVQKGITCEYAGAVR